MLVHLYYGEGKGKSTAAAGLALRALSAGFRVYIIRFLKGGGPESGEIPLLKKLGAVIVDGKETEKFTGRMTEAEREGTRFRQDKLLTEFASGNPGSALKSYASGDPGSVSELLVLDEALAAVNYGLLDEELLRRVVTERPENREIVLTGRDPKEWMLKEADYVTEFRCVRHPYEKGIQARRGVEL